ncbi:MAG: hypothetical protein KAR54_02610 [Candidatus Pacebacteria bacterium]|nr:hypothetical protein [Candidatus Paceibacterota bacterium]
MLVEIFTFFGFLSTGMGLGYGITGKKQRTKIIGWVASSIGLFTLHYLGVKF